MPTFSNLPGVLVNTLDNGLVATRAPKSQSTLVLGTAASGPAGTPYTIVDKTAAAKLFGTTGTLMQGVGEVSANSDNIIAFRIGATPAVLRGVGATSVGRPTAPTDTATGAPTVETHTYSIVARNSLGTTLPSPGLTVTSAGGLDTSDYLTLTWTAVTGATSYDVLKSGATAATGTGSFLLANVSTTTYADKGTTTTTYTVPTQDTSGTPGITITLGEVASTTSTDYTICYSNGVLNLYLKGNLVYTNGTSPVDIGDSIVTGTASAGLALGTSPASAANAITLTAAAALSGSANTPAPTLTAAVTGLGMTKRETYVALAKAFDLLDATPVSQVYVPGVYIDTPNVALKGTVDDASTGAVLDWLKTTKASDGHLICQWASETTDSDGTTVTPPTLTDAGTRLSLGFHEVNFGYQLARFCALQTQVNSSCIGFIGCMQPPLFDLLSIRTWVGSLPTYDPVSGLPIAPGTGLLGIPCLTGTTASGLSTLCSDYASGHRLPGFFDSDNGEYDGGANTDANGNPIDIGSYIHVAGDWVYMSNSFGNYIGNIAGMVAGVCASLDQRSSLLNTPLAGVRTLYNLSPIYLDALTQADVNVLRFKGSGVTPALLHDKTAAAVGSDYTLLSRVRLKGLLVDDIRQVSDKFLGKAAADGMALSALKTALDAKGSERQKNGYLSRYQFTISSTLIDQKLGHATVQVAFMPAMELVQLTANVGISRS